MKNRALHDPAGVANKHVARFAGPFHGHLDAFDHAQRRYLLQKRLALRKVGLGRFRGLDEHLHIFRFFPLQLQKLVALFGGHHRGFDKRCDQRRRCAQPVEIFKQFLNGGDRQIANNRPKDFDRTRRIPGERIGHAGPARKFRGAVREHFRSRIRAGERCHHIGQGLRQQASRGLFTNHFIRVSGQNCEDFDAGSGRERSGVVANSDLALSGRAARTDLFAHHVANCRLLPSLSRILL